MDDDDNLIYALCVSLLLCSLDMLWYTRDYNMEEKKMKQGEVKVSGLNQPSPARRRPAPPASSGPPVSSQF
jgi:hypothetical protein